jgi:hypothetical protein
VAVHLAAVVAGDLGQLAEQLGVHSEVGQVTAEDRVHDLGVDGNERIDLMDDIGHPVVPLGKPGIVEAAPVVVEGSGGRLAGLWDGHVLE